MPQSPLPAKSFRGPCRCTLRVRDAEAFQSRTFNLKNIYSNMVAFHNQIILRQDAGDGEFPALVEFGGQRMAGGALGETRRRGRFRSGSAAFSGKMAGATLFRDTAGRPRSLSARPA
jgi:hypothetical protein